MYVPLDAWLPIYVVPATVAVLVTATQVVTAATVTLSDYYYRSWNGIIDHHEGASTSNFVVNTAQTGSVGPLVVSNSTSYASAYGSSDYLNLVVSSNVDGSTINELGLDYAIAEGTAWFEADLVITGGTGNALLDIDALYNEASTSNPNTYITGEQRIRIYDDTNSLVFAYLNGVSNITALDNILLNYDDTYRFQMTSTAYSKADVGFLASNQREFTASMTAVSAVPIPGALFLLFSGASSLFVFTRMSKTRVTT